MSSIISVFCHEAKLVDTIKELNNKGYYVTQGKRCDLEPHSYLLTAIKISKSNITTRYLNL